MTAAEMADFQDLLIKTSRTFAASIPLLEEPCRHQVTIAYLLFRIADTFEDAHSWPRQERQRALDEFAEMVAGKTEDISAVVETWLRREPSEHAGYLELVAETEAVIAELEAFEPRAREAVRRHTVRTAEGMKGFVSRSDGKGTLRLRDLEDLREYCYVVAGIVGEMLTDLFVLHSPQLQGVAGELERRAATFGEALQLVNILKDSEDDRREGRCFLPPRLDRQEVFALARSDLEVAGEYVELVRNAGGAAGTVAFTSLPVRLAWATLRTVEAEGPGSKITRSEVLEILQQVRDAVADGRSPVTG